MKLVKILSLAAIAAIAAMALVGTSSAFAKGAVLLCKEQKLECQNPWASPVTIVVHATEPKLLTSAGTFVCEKSLAEITLLQAKLESLILGHILSLSFEGNCHIINTQIFCTVTVSEVGGISITHGPNKLEWIARTVPHLLGETSMNTIANVKCGGTLINCTYELGEETEMTATNGEGDITLVANEAELKRSKGFCPETSKWDATYLTLAVGSWLESSSASPEPHPVLLCEKQELECKSPWPNPTTRVAHATSPKLLSSIGTVECEKSLAEITLLNTAAESILAHVLSLSFEGNCKLGSTKCTVTVSEVGGISVEHGPNKLEWIAKPVPLSLGETSMNTKANVKCGFLINCTYEGGEETETTATNGAEGDITLVANEAPLKRSKGFCPETSKWDATYLTLASLAGDLWLES